MPTVTPDLINGHELVEDDGGLRIVRPYIVSGLNPNTSALVQAYGLAGLPQYNDADDDFPLLVCREFRIVPFATNSKESVRVVATFKPADSTEVPVVRFSATAREVVSEFYPNTRIPLKIRYKPAVGPEMEPFTAQRRDAKRIGVLEVDRIESALPAHALTYIGAMNSDTWQGQPKYTWYCRTVAFEKEVYRSGYRVYYEFEYDPELHIDTLAFRRDFDGRVPEDIDPVDTNLPAAPGPRFGWINVGRGRLMPFSALTNVPAVFG